MAEVAPVDTDELSSFITREINYRLTLVEHVQTSGKSSCLIPKVQKHIRKLDSAAYEPNILSIGRYHHGNPCLQAIQKKKWNCLNFMLHTNRHVKLDDYLNKIAELEVQARNCYLSEIKMDSSDFLQMLLLDGCFILVHLHGIDGTEISRNEIDGGHNPDKREKGSIIEHGTECNSETECSFGEIKERNAIRASANIRQLEHTEHIVELSQISHQEKVRDKFYHGHYQDGKWYYSLACHDILMLENQIPFFVVKTIYKLFANTQDVNRLTDNIAKFIEGTLYFYPKAIQDADRPKDFHHLLHLCYMYFLPSQQRQQKQPVIRSAFHRDMSFLFRKLSRADYQKEEKEQDLRAGTHFPPP